MHAVREHVCALLNDLISIYVNSNSYRRYVEPLVELTLAIGNQGQCNVARV